MTITVDPEAAVLDDLLVERGEHNGMTKIVHRIKKNGTLTFKNNLNPNSLTIESQDSPPPFLVPGVVGAQSQFIVSAGTNMTVTVSGAYDVGDQFAYSAQFEGAAAEDPIVIIDRH